MQGIELSSEQQAKLVEMCKVAFPEYTTMYMPIDNDATSNLGFIKFIDGDKVELIHWFELCMTKLPLALDISFSQDQNEQGESMWSWDEYEREVIMFDQFKQDKGDFNIYYKKFHLVDGLYYKFKEDLDQDQND